MDAKKSYNRFKLAERLEHVLLIFSFGILGLTGIPQKFFYWPIFENLIDILGGIETIRVVHRIAAFVAMLETIYHLVVMGYKIFVQKKALTMLPGIKDGKDALQALAHNLGFRKEGPKMGRYSFAEKAEYLAMMWGFIVMGVTGFMLWNPIATTKILPGQFIPAAKAAHGWEAVLAVLAIILWHFYNVHVKHWNWSMVTGKISRHEMEEEHAEELEEIEAGLNVKNLNPDEVWTRKAIYMPVATLLSIVMLGGVYFFVNYEETAIITLPSNEGKVQVYVPQTPVPLPTKTATPIPAPVSDDLDYSTWSGGISTYFEESCISCHGTMGDISFENYEAALTGGPDGTLIVAGDSANSPLIVQQQEGGHMGQFTDDQLAKIMEWIEAGAEE
ncbi:MAG: cytochrome b/b6 domain-containing protein [Anaerolineaceae bacterium]|nr:cytochrome b/b6 domain-containing protein [Anaerolineaceae bacterium]